MLGTKSIIKYTKSEVGTRNEIMKRDKNKQKRRIKNRIRGCSI